MRSQDRPDDDLVIPELQHAFIAGLARPAPGSPFGASRRPVIIGLGFTLTVAVVAVVVFLWLWRRHRPPGR